MIDAAGLAEFTGLPEPEADEVVMYAEEYADVMEQSVEEERRQAEEAAAEQARLEAEARPRPTPKRPKPPQPKPPRPDRSRDRREGAAANRPSGRSGRGDRKCGNCRRARTRGARVVSESDEVTETPADADSDADKPAE